jgi:hypothetical protein
MIQDLPDPEDARRSASRSRARDREALDRRQPLAPGPKRVRELFPAASECAAWKTRIP